SSVPIEVSDILLLTRCQQLEIRPSPGTRSCVGHVEAVSRVVLSLFARILELGTHALDILDGFLTALQYELPEIFEILVRKPGISSRLLLRRTGLGAFDSGVALERNGNESRLDAISFLVSHVCKIGDFRVTKPRCGQQKQARRIPPA